MTWKLSQNGGICLGRIITIFKKSLQISGNPFFIGNDAVHKMASSYCLCVKTDSEKIQNTVQSAEVSPMQLKIPLQ